MDGPGGSAYMDVQALPKGHGWPPLLAGSVALALLVVVEKLAPAERVAFVPHDMFAVPFDEIAPITRQREVVDAFLAQAAPVDGAAGAVWPAGGRPRVVFAFTIARGKIVAIDLLADRARLRELDLVVRNE